MRSFRFDFAEKKKQFINMLLVVGDGADVSRKVGMEFSFAICNFG